MAVALADLAGAADWLPSGARNACADDMFVVGALVLALILSEVYPGVGVGWVGASQLEVSWPE